MVSMAMSSSCSTNNKHKSALPSSAFFKKPGLWKYGCDLEDYWRQLKAALAHFKKFYVVDAESQQHQAEICRLVDSSADSDGWGIVHWLAHRSDIRLWHGVIRPALLVQDLLRMGAHPDLVDADPNLQQTPSHISSARGCSAVEVAKSLVLCRVDLKAMDADGDTPAANAREYDNPEAANIFEDAEKNGFPTIAQLAQEKKWWAVQNLCRRGVVPDQEKLAVHNGKDAIGWAVHHEKLGIARERKFLLKGVVQPKDDGFIEDKLDALKAELLNKMGAEKEAAKKVFDEQAEHLKQLKADQAILKKDGEQLKEMLLLTLEEAKRDREGLKKEPLSVAAVTKEKNAKRKKDLEKETSQHQPSEQQQKRMKVDYINANRDPQQTTKEGESRPGAHDVGPDADPNAAEENEISVLKAENKALKERVDRQQEIMRTQRVLLRSLLKEDV